MALSGEPGVAARNAQDLWTFLEVFRPGLQARVRERLPHATLETLDGTIRTAWIKLDLDRHFVDAIITELGEEGAAELWRSFTRRFLANPFVRPFFEATKRLLGLSILSVARQSPRMWDASFRNAGEMTAIEQDDDSVVLLLTDLHPWLMDHEGYMIAIPSMYRGLYDILGREPNMQWETHRGDRRAMLVLTR